MPPDKAKEIVKKYAGVLQKNNIVFRRIYLFGSQVKKTSRRNSDIDVAVVFRNLKKNESKMEKMILLWRLAPEADIRIEPIVLEENDFKKGYTSTLANEVQKGGVLVKS